MSRLTRDQVAEIVGDVGDVKLAEIIATGATIEQLEEAVSWAAGISRVGRDLKRPLAGVVAEIYGILTSDQAFDEDRE